MAPEPLRLPVGVLAPETLELSCARAVVALERHTEPAAALDAALGELHDALADGFVSALVLEHEHLWLIGTRGYTTIPDGIPLDEGIVGRAASSGVTQFVPDVDTDSDFIPVGQGVRSELVLSVSDGDELLGVLDVESTAQLPNEAPRLLEPLAARLVPVFAAMRSDRTIDLSTLARLFVRLGSLREATAIADIGARSLARVIPLETCQIALVEAPGRLADVASWQAAGDAPEPLAPRALEAVRGLLEPSAVFELLDTAGIRVPQLVGSKARTIVIVPLRANGEELGVLVGQSRFPREHDHRHAELASLLGAHVAASIDASLALSRERRSALTDPLTGLLNRRGLEERLEQELTASQEVRAPLSLLVIDGDDFKDVNDRAGHEFGDALLREIGAVLTTVTPAGGSASRVGGDEFVVVFPGVDAESALDRARQLLIELRAGLDAAGFPLHLSGGVATYPYDGGAASQLLRAADQALYSAKEQGKGRAIAYRDLVRGSATSLAVAGQSDRRTGRGEGALGEVLEAATAITVEREVAGVLDRLAKSVTFVVGATGCLVSIVEHGRLTDAVRHALRDVDFGDEVAYLIDDFPLTRDVLETGRSRSISFLDDDLDRAEAFVLREVRMNCCLLAALTVAERPWGLVEVYDMRMRRFSREDESIVEFLITHAGRRIEALGAATPRRRLPLFRLPGASSLRD